MRKEEIRADDPMVRAPRRLSFLFVWCHACAIWKMDPTATRPFTHPWACCLSLHGTQAEYMLNKQRKAQAASGVKLKPEYKGPAPKPNRFNIKYVRRPVVGWVTGLHV